MIPGICLFCKNNFRKRERKYKFCTLLCANRYNLNRLNETKLPDKSTNLAKFIGMCLGDGYISKYQVSITLNSLADKEYLPYVLNLITKLFTGASISIIRK